MTSRTMWLAGVAVAAALAVPAGMAAAMGGGGGGGGGGSMPSASEPQYDPVQEYQRGVADLQAGRYKDAVRDFEHVTDAQSRNANGWYMLGMAKTGAGDVKGAAKAYQKAIKLDAGPVAPHREYALSLIKLKDTPKAQAELDALKARATTCGDACPEAADLKAAVAAIEQAMAATPTASTAAPSSLIFANAEDGDRAYVRAVSLINERRFGEAWTALDEAEHGLGPHPDILTYKGYVSRKLGRLDDAERYYKAALAQAPNHRGATEYYGELKVVRGDVAGARLMLARLDSVCAFGCAEAEELRRWIDHGGDPGS